MPEGFNFNQLREWLRNNPSGTFLSNIDKRLTEQVNQILHHEDFQRLEGAWRGLYYLVNNTETDEMLKIRVMSISKRELHRTLMEYRGASWETS